MLRRNGAEVSSAAAINIIALPEDDELQHHTEAVIAEPPDILVAHTGIGFRGWVAAADGWGLATQLLASLVQVADRGPRAEGDRRVARRRAARGVVARNPSRRAKCCATCSNRMSPASAIAVQLHGAADEWDPFPEFIDGLRAAGAQVVPIHVYRWKPTPAGRRLRPTRHRRSRGGNSTR